MNPSGVMTTPEPAAAAAPTRRFATDGPSFSATETTTREYASRASISVVTYEMIVAARQHLTSRTIVACMQAKVASTQRAFGSVGAGLGAPEPRGSSADLFRVVAELDLSFSQVKMLFLLEDGGEHSVKEIAAHLGLSLPAASRAVDGLIERGYVTRRESAEDRRSRLVALTDSRPRGRGPRAARPARDPRRVRRRAHARRAGQPPTPPSSPSSKGSLASDRPHPTLRGKPPLVDARGHVLRAVHGDARQHRRQRRAAVDPAQLRRLPVVAGVDDQRLHASRSPSCSSPAAGSATSSAAARSS